MFKLFYQIYKIICFFLFVFNITTIVFSQKKEGNNQKVNELYFKKNVVPIFKSSCTCHQGITDYNLAFPKAQKIWEVVQHPHGQMSVHLKKDYLPIIEYWVKTIHVQQLK